MRTWLLSISPPTPAARSNAPAFDISRSLIADSPESSKAREESERSAHAAHQRARGHRVQNVSRRQMQRDDGELYDGNEGESHRELDGEWRNCKIGNRKGERGGERESSKGIAVNIRKWRGDDG